METEQGTIVRITKGKAIIQMEAGSQCQACGAKHACMALSNETLRHIEIPVVDNIKVGDHILLGYRPKYRIISAFLVFIVPILLLIAGYFIGDNIFRTEGKAVLSAFIGLILAFILIWGLNKILIKNKNYLPTILKVENLTGLK